MLTCGRNILSKFTNKEFKSEIERLLDNGADVNSINWNGRTFISHAAEYRQFHISQFLLKSGVNVDIRDFAGRIPFFFAAESDFSAII
jgi:ankyrin repeat protein